MMRAATVLTLAALVMGVSDNEVQAGEVIKKKLGLASFEIHNYTVPFGVAVQLKRGPDTVVFEGVFEPGDQELTEQTVGQGTPFILCFSPLFRGAPTYEVEIEEPAADECVHVDIILDQESQQLDALVGEFECSDQGDQDQADAGAIRESIALAGSTSGLLLLAFAGSLFGRARRPEEELPAAE